MFQSVEIKMKSNQRSGDYQTGRHSIVYSRIDLIDNAIRFSIVGNTIFVYTELHEDS